MEWLTEEEEVAFVRYEIPHPMIQVKDLLNVAESSDRGSQCGSWRVATLREEGIAEPVPENLARGSVGWTQSGQASVEKMANGC